MITAGMIALIWRDTLSKVFLYWFTNLGTWKTMLPQLPTSPIGINSSKQQFCRPIDLTQHEWTKTGDVFIQI